MLMSIYYELSPLSKAHQLTSLSIF
uniref:Uncharacterized protein n=1 Tax=Anguilla anguilla TaxID=7936 RepID=A0A0E9U3M6_ANGAN